MKRPIHQARQLCAALAAVTSLAIACSTASSGAEFKATVVTRQQGKTQSLLLLVKGSKYRLNGNLGGQEGTILVDLQAKKVDMLDPSAKKVSEGSTDNPLVAFVDPLLTVEAATVMSQGEAKKVGTEMVSGYLCDKYALSAKDSTVLINYWVARKLGFLLKFIQPQQGGMTMEVTNIREGPVADSLFEIPPDYAMAVQPGPKLPAWAGDVASAPVLGVPTQRVMSAGEIIRVKVSAGQKIDVECKDATPDVQYTAAPFKNGKPTEDVMQHTNSNGEAISSSEHLAPAPPGGEEIVVRVNKGKGLIVVHLAPAS